MAAIGDYGPAAELMESAVAQVSRYLDRKGAMLSSRKHGLLMVAFHRALRLYRAKYLDLSSLEVHMNFQHCASTQSRIAQAHVWLEFEKLIQRLSARNADVLAPRSAGFEWKEIARCFGESVANLRNRFWREIDRLW